MNIHHNNRNIHTILHTLNIVYIIKSMNIGFQKKIYGNFIQYTYHLIYSLSLNIHSNIWIITPKKALARYTLFHKSGDS